MPDDHTTSNRVCGICGRRTIPWQVFNHTPAWLFIGRLFIGRMECGGDCWRCVNAVEQWMEDA